MSTIQDVAKRASVSAGTVSRYLNGYQLKVANQNRVEAAIEELGYRSNYLARSLRSNRSMSTGLLINNMLNHFAVSVVAQAERKMELNDYNITSAVSARTATCSYASWRTSSTAAWTASSCASPSRTSAPARSIASMK